MLDLRSRVQVFACFEVRKDSIKTQAKWRPKPFKDYKLRTQIRNNSKTMDEFQPKDQNTPDERLQMTIFHAFQLGVAL